MTEIKIEKAQINDIKAIVAINHQNLIINKKNLSVNELENSGFLIKAYSEDLVRFYLQNEKYVTWSAKLNNDVVGYVICCQLSEEPELLDYIKTLPESCHLTEKTKVLYISQIAKAGNVTGIGKKLMNELLHYALQNNYQYITGQIIHKPACNKASVLFHKKFGFAAIAEIIRDDGKTAGVYLKKLDSL